jgi:hypothetical protein
MGCGIDEFKMREGAERCDTRNVVSAEKASPVVAETLFHTAASAGL